MTKRKNKHFGELFDDFLKETCELAAANEVAKSRIMAWEETHLQTSSDLIKDGES